MQQPTLASDRVVDPIITEVARGYGGDFAPVANILFPIVPVGQRAGKIIAFGPEDFYLYNTLRAPGENTKRLQFGYAGTPFSLGDHSLEASVPIERLQEANAVPGINLVSMSVRKVQRILDRERENQAATLARNPANYPAANKSAPVGADKWDDPASDPFTQVQDARFAVRAKVGQLPDTMEMGAPVYEKLSTHPAVLARLSSNDIKVATLAQLELLFRMKIVVGEGVYYVDAVTGFVDLWGKDVILAVTTPKSMAEMGSPSFGYTYQLSGYPIVEEGYYDKNSKTWYYPYSDAYQAQLVGATSGFLIQSAVN